MKKDDIEKLLDRYYDGSTSEAEEAELRRFFESGDVPRGMLADKRMFMAMQASKEPEMPAGMDERLSAMIDGKARRSRVVRMRMIGAAAAVLCLLFGTAVFYHDDSPRYAVTEKDTCSTPEEAAEQTERALLAFSKALNKGRAGLEKVGETGEEINNKITKHLKILNNR